MKVINLPAMAVTLNPECEMQCEIIYREYTFQPVSFPHLGTSETSTSSFNIVRHDDPYRCLSFLWLQLTILACSVEKCTTL